MGVVMIGEGKDQWGLDEFELKPLTSGLGFHPRRQVLNMQSSLTAPSVSNVHKTTKAVIRPSYLEPEPEPSSETELSAQEVLSQLKSRRNQWFEPETSSRLTPSIRPLSDAFTQPAVIGQVWLMDILVLVAIGLLGLVVWISAPGNTFFLLWNKADLGYKLLLIFSYSLVIITAYSISFRLFLGQTLGEWSENVQVQPLALNPRFRFLQMFVRSLLAPVSIALGLGLLSLILKKDLLGILTGTRLTFQHFEKES